ncbi:MAG: class I SAM-dependent methyltransferase [Candidatus Cloacimonetes bacterium]|nr:class I SAM-dependent methyltransferase [Candidatus Cloacimonadota bacterium]
MKYYESPTMGKVNKIVFGIDLKQHGMFTKAEMDLLLTKIKSENPQNILDIGSGACHIANYMSEQTSAHFTCIDIDEEAMEYAKNQFQGNDKLCVKLLDFKDIAKLNQKFSMILAIDTLYFVSNIEPENFEESVRNYYESLKSTIANLYSLLDDGGKLVIFWSELPFFKLEKKEPEYTQVGMCIKELGYNYQAIDLTEGEKEFWRKFQTTLLQYEEDLRSEGSKELFDATINEANFMLIGVEKDKLYRNMYIIS